MEHSKFKTVAYAFIVPLLLLIYGWIEGEELGLIQAVIIYPFFNVIFIAAILKLYFVKRATKYLILLTSVEIGMILTYSTDMFIGNIIMTRTNYLLRFLSPIASLPDAIFNFHGAFLSEYFTIMFIFVMIGIIMMNFPAKKIARRFPHKSAAT